MTPPKHLEAELDKLGLPRPAPEPGPVLRREGPIWTPSYRGEEPPF